MNNLNENPIAHIQHRKVYLIGGGIASLPAAAYFIKDGHINPSNITIYANRCLRLIGNGQTSNTDV